MKKMGRINSMNNMDSMIDITKYVKFIKKKFVSDTLVKIVGRCHDKNKFYDRHQDLLDELEEELKIEWDKYKDKPSKRPKILTSDISKYLNKEKIRINDDGKYMLQDNILKERLYSSPLKYASDLYIEPLEANKIFVFRTNPEYAMMVVKRLKEYFLGKNFHCTIFNDTIVCFYHNRKGNEEESKDITVKEIKEAIELIKSHN
jgi:hypothetical protein